jgi:hypothetical protein
MRYTPENFLQFIKLLITGRNGDDTPVAGTLLPGNSNGTTTSSAQSADGGIKVDKNVDLVSLGLTQTGLSPAIVDNTGGAASTTFAAITAGASYAQADMVAVKNALAEIAKILNAQNVNASGNPQGSMFVLTVPTGTTNIGTFTLTIPRDYDEASDNFKVRLEANLANADASITVTAAGQIAHIASQLPTSTAVVSVATSPATVSGTAPFSTTTLDLTQEVQVFEIKLSGNNLKRDDVITVVLALAGTTSGAAYVYNVEYHYDSTIVSYNDTDATQSPNGSIATVQPGFGNALR